MRHPLWYSIPILLSIGVGALMLFKEHSLRTRTTPSVVGRSLSEFNVPCIDPRHGNLTTQDLKGRFTLLVFFASWCKYCHAHLSLLRGLSRYPQLDLIGVNIKDDPVEFKKWFAKNKSSFKKIVTDPQASLVTQLNIKGVPETFLIDPQGKIIFHHQGLISASQIQEVLLSKVFP